MNEQELNATMSVIADPINNVYKLETRADIEEIQRICRIFAISEKQANKHKMLSIKNFLPTISAPVLQEISGRAKMRPSMSLLQPCRN